MDCIILETTPEPKQGRYCNAGRMNGGKQEQDLQQRVNRREKKRRKKERNRAGGVMKREQRPQTPRK
jgi:hypothetical protein